MGGGLILHPNPSKHKSTDLGAIDALMKLDGNDIKEKIPVLLSVDAKRAIDIKGNLRKPRNQGLRPRQKRSLHIGK